MYIAISSHSYPNTSKRKDVFYEMSSACPEYEMRFTRRDNMKRHFNSRHENMKCIPPPPKETCYDYTPPPPPKETGYDYTPPPPPPKETGYDYTPPPPPKETGYDYTPPPLRGPELSSLQHQTEREEPYFIYSTGDPFVFKVPSGRLLDHFIPWVHPFTSVISDQPEVENPSLSGDSYTISDI